MPTDDREQQFERALARHFGSASPDSACPDAETLAAYHERRLSLEEMSRSKDHIAGCPRCQESLALVEQTENLHAEEWEQQNLAVPAELAASKTLRARGASVHPDRGASAASPIVAATTPIGKVAARPPWRWIVPIGALAAGVIVWIGVQEIRTQHNSSISAVQVARSRPEAPQPPVPSYGIADQVKKAEPPARKLDEEIRDQKAAPSAAPKPASPQRMESAENLNAPPPPSFEGAFTTQKDLEMDGAPKATAPQPAAPRPRTAAKALLREIPVPTAADSNAPAGVAGGALDGRVENAPANAKEKQQEKVPAATQTVTVESSAAAVDTASNSALTTNSTDLQLSARHEINLLQVAATDRRLIVAPGEKHAWRVGEAGKIERSTDGGKTWKLQNSGVTRDLIAGSASSDKVCWVVGKAGIVLLTADGGKHWKPIATPITEDLGGIHATDPLHASIWDVPNRKKYETSDGGRTWSQTSIK